MIRLLRSPAVLDETVTPPTVKETRWPTRRGAGEIIGRIHPHADVVIQAKHDEMDRENAGAKVYCKCGDRIASGTQICLNCAANDDGGAA